MFSKSHLQNQQGISPKPGNTTQLHKHREKFREVTLPKGQPSNSGGWQSVDKCPSLPSLQWDDAKVHSMSKFPAHYPVGNQKIRHHSQLFFLPLLTLPHPTSSITSQINSYTQALISKPAFEATLIKMVVLPVAKSGFIKRAPHSCMDSGPKKMKALGKKLLNRFGGRVSIGK